MKSSSLNIINNLADENANGIEAPDLIGWFGSQPNTLADGTKISAALAVSGDLSI